MAFCIVTISRSHLELPLQSESTGIQLGGKRKKLEVSSVFNQDEDEENNDSSRKLKLSLPSEEDKRVGPCHQNVFFLQILKLLLSKESDSITFLLDITIVV